jgi:hypothetical protein
MNAPRSMLPFRPPPSQNPADWNADAAVPTKLLVRSPYPTGTVEKAPVSALGVSDDCVGFVSSAHAAPTSGVITAMRYHARMLLRPIAVTPGLAGGLTRSIRASSPA